MDSVRAHENIAGDLGAIGERGSYAFCVLLEALDTRVQAEACVAEASEQDVEQVGAVRVVVRRTEMRLRPLAERCVVEAFAFVPRTVVPSLRIDGHARERLTETERAQNPCRIG